MRPKPPNDTRRRQRILAAIACVVLVSAGCNLSRSDDFLQVWRVPGGGRLPQAVVDKQGKVHLVYFAGEAMTGDLWYVTRAEGDGDWSEPVRVNSEPDTVTGAGPIDGGQLAIGMNGRLHVAWFRLNPVIFFYTRTDETGTGFEEQFDLAGGEGVEAAPAVVADDAGNVYLFWHSGLGEEAQRRVWMAASHDDGLIWDTPHPVNGEGEGACNCCGLQALHIDGTLYVSYRGAGDNERRSQRLLTSVDGGGSFADTPIDPWELNACPVTTSSLAHSPAGPIVAWETRGEVYYAPVADPGGKTRPEGEASARRKHPHTATNPAGQTLVVWSDGPGFRSGGTLHWQVFDAERQPISEAHDGGEIPEGSRPVALSSPDGGFIVIY